VRCFDTLAAQQNDTILITFWMRTLSAASGNGFAMLVVEQGGDPWAKSVEWSVGAKSEWKKVEVPFSMLQDFVRGSLASGANTYNVSFWVNAVQEIEIGGITAQNYGLAYPFADLGLTTWPYEGHALDAPWRAAAAERIERIRKADIVVVARDAQGNPLADAAVHVKMKKHAFGFGTAVNATLLTSNNPQQPTYAQHILQMFNYAVLENEMKWPMWEANRNPALQAVAWLRSNGITVRGHNLIWPGRSNLPAGVVAMLNPPVNAEALRTRIHDHFTDILNATRGTLVDWDVLNEPVTNRDVMNALGDAEMAAWFQWAREIDPNVKLYTNDYGIVTNGGYDPHQDQFYNVIQYILDHGGPVDGIGLQSHFGGALTPPERVLEILDRFAGFGKDLQVTEFDINTTDEQLQADYTRDFITAAFSHPAIKGFLMWGFWAGAHWLPNAALLRLDWSAKPNYDVWMDLTQHQWWTDVEGRTDANGVFRTRGFLGDYDIEVAGQTVAATVAAGDTPNYVFAGAHGLPDFAADGVVNAASLLAGPVAPGEIVEFRGTGFGWPETAAGLPSAGQLPVSGGDLRVLFDGVAAPMLYSLTGRAAAIVPYGVSGTTSAQIEYLGARSPVIALPVVPAAPGVFCTFGSCALNLGAGGEAATNTATHPADKGGRVALFLTGDGLMSPEATDGRLPPASDGPRPVLPVVVRIGGVESTCPDNWAGLVYAGVTEVIACVPESAPSGAVGLEVTVGGVAAQSGMTVAVR
jgi:endo-1,4-beta-xylanase